LLADCRSMQDRREEAVAIFERVLALRNDVGLLSEECHPRLRRQMGNFPQALSHLASTQLPQRAFSTGDSQRPQAGGLQQRPKPATLD
jgi:hypothetical protein